MFHKSCDWLLLDFKPFFLGSKYPEFGAMNDISKALRDPSPEKRRQRKQIARFREVYDDIEAALRDGFTRAYVIGVLAENGFAVKENTFNTMLSKVRAERGAAGSAALPEDGTAALPAPPAADRTLAGGAAVPAVMGGGTDPLVHPAGPSGGTPASTPEAAPTAKTELAVGLPLTARQEREKFAARYIKPTNNDHLYLRLMRKKGNPT
jgi:hypothetical protein